MKKLPAFIVAAALLCQVTFAQADLLSRKTGASAGADPQFALSILTDYFEKDERGLRTGGAVLTGIGALAFSAGLAGSIYSLTPPVAGGLYENSDGQLLVRGLSIGTAGAGLVMAGIGIGMLARPHERYKRDYAYLFAESDPVVQEALAYGIMNELAGTARRNRIAGGLISISLPLATAGGYAVSAALTDSWETFDDKVIGSLAWTLPSLIGGIINLVSGKSNEERMLDSYKSMSASYAMSARRKD